MEIWQEIDVLDINDNPPLLANATVEGKISEDALSNTPLISLQNTPLRVQASDPDAGFNATLVYRIITCDYVPTSTFTIDQSTGVIRLAHESIIDFERAPRITCQLLVTDAPGLSAAHLLQLQVLILDVNDESPYFLTEALTVSLLVPTFDQAPVTVARAYDKDADDTLAYSLLVNEHSHLFAINSSSGAIHVTQAQELNKQSSSLRSVSLSVSVTDAAKHQCLRSMIVNLHLLAAKLLLTATPDFGIVRDIHLSLPEQYVGDARLRLGQLTVDPRASGVNYKFVLLGYFPGLALDAHSGVVYGIGDEANRGEKRLDREQYPGRQELQFLVRNSLGFAVTGKLLLQLQDANDNSPQFLNEPYHAIVASDADLDDNAKINYRLVSMFPKGQLEILSLSEENGLMALDEDALTQTTPLTEWFGRQLSVMVAAKDGGQRVENTTVSISLASGLGPLLPEPVFHLSVPEDTVPGEEIYRFRASIPKSAPARLLYRLLVTIPMSKQQQKRREEIRKFFDFITAVYFSPSHFPQASSHSPFIVEPKTGEYWASGFQLGRGNTHFIKLNLANPEKYSHEKCI
ncbi:bahd acyltransferase [Cichlidogyrus casuarinus]|uniref:Bahd acyltransferase n=1 Tax=Cichlidogyrus casuarinus TaxID=1844966 RepID=A0ABD2QLK3_9PLAT